MVFAPGQVDRADVGDTGRYTCEALNQVGRSEKHYNLNVWGEGLPGWAGLGLALKPRAEGGAALSGSQDTAFPMTHGQARAGNQGFRPPPHASQLGGALGTHRGTALSLCAGQGRRTHSRGTFT